MSINNTNAFANLHEEITAVQRQFQTRMEEVQDKWNRLNQSYVEAASESYNQQTTDQQPIEQRLEVLIESVIAIAKKVDELDQLVKTKLGS